MGMPFKNTAGFGKRMEYKLIGDMLMEGLDVYVPLVDDHSVDCVVKRADGTFIEVQIKARSKSVKQGDEALFAAITHEKTPNFYFVFCSDGLLDEKGDPMMWIMTSEEFIKEAVRNKTGKNAGKRSIWFNGHNTNRKTGKKESYCKKQFEKYLCKGFDKFH